MKKTEDDMTDIPPLPKSRRNLSDLDSLIADSIGRLGSYDGVRGAPTGNGNAVDPLATEGLSQPVAPLNSGSIGEKPERFQIALSGAVIIAAKLEALKQKTTASDITERALRSYLGLSAKD
ncbi:hypothetical protein G6K88_31130 [Agrobacterium rhizogenes]|uniref:hypothetical protein n=1 Tax=Rhizobium rhizogenes TaxID=359 RepID=UPI0015719A3A|nr:hypothetical protein [Rhizobium rhizogenes]NTG18244.1 hypothetical protein [Rhizobium rhizogenes]NTG38846.1 hypothetical protein [Rhizobium rhizogenes]NTG57979.1 hypothetical protein [Rhizobium rhizogenes]NTH03573.1 hypothetical protein [Rhizobium rhizogenes]NTI06495.1 hypothetical protein [Rhizobium rhizogenes]